MKNTKVIKRYIEVELRNYYDDKHSKLNENLVDNLANEFIKSGNKSCYNWMNDEFYKKLEEFENE